MLDEMLEFLRTRRKMNLLMVLINVVVYIALEIIGNTESAVFMLSHGAAYVPLIRNGEYYRLFTAMFLHFGLIHLIYNMIALVAMGDELEAKTGAVRYLIIYIIGGLAGNLASMFWDMRTGEYGVSAGASGAVFAVLGAVFCIVIRERGLESAMAKRMAFVTVLMIAQGVIDGNVDNAAHVGGVVAGFLLCLLLYRPKKRQYWY